MATDKSDGRMWAIFGLLLLCALVTSVLVQGEPSGASVTSASSETAVNKTAGSRSDSRGTITTMILDAIQQDQHWKAYVGNVTGTLTLDDALNNTIYDWSLSTISGEVYASRNGSLSWTTVTCATNGTVVNESVFHNMTNSDPDDINSTFTAVVHGAMQVGTNSIAQNTCNSTATYINSTAQTLTTTTYFQEILLQDTNGFMIYATPLVTDQGGFDNNTYDFQMIVAESHVKASPTTYYFYVELGS